MSVTPRIEPATAGDIATLVQLVRGYWNFEGIDGFDAARCAAVLDVFFSRPELGCGWIVWVGPTALGYLLACYVFSLEHGGLTAEIDELFLLPDYRSAGLGRRLLETAEAGFRRAGCTNVALQLGRENADGRRFYARCGYSARDYDLMDKTLV